MSAHDPIRNARAPAIVGWCLHPAAGTRRGLAPTLRPEGEASGPENAAILNDEQSVLVVDIGHLRAVRAIVLQADADDSYMVESSTDGKQWTGLVKIEPGLEGAGLRTRHASLPVPTRARFLAVHAAGGDQSYFVAELRAYEELPAEWPPLLQALRAPTATAAPTTPPPVTVHGLGEENVLFLKALLAAAGLAALARCQARFSKERWAAFVEDVAWFRARTSEAGWRQILSGHGFNGTPAWAILGGLLSNAGPATDDRLAVLTAIDSALLLVMWCFAAWAFGWPAAAVALLFWGTNYPARFFWTGGAFLRMDWLVALVVGVCLLRKSRPGSAGALLALAALLRIFPGAVFLGLAAAVVGRSIAARRLSLRPDERRFAWGALATVLVVVPLSLLAMGGWRTLRWTAWTEFARNSGKHLSTPLTNNMGVSTLLSWRAATRAETLERVPDTDPFGAWKDAHRATASRMRPIALLLALGALGAFAWRFRDRPLWLVAASAVGLIPFLGDLTCYYASVYLVLALLSVERGEAGPLWSGVALLTGLTPSVVVWDEDRYALVTFLVLAALAVTIWRVSSGRRVEASAAPPSRAEPPPSRVSTTTPAAPCESFESTARLAATADHWRRRPKT